jgi:hypothetical protein
MRRWSSGQLRVIYPEASDPDFLYPDPMKILAGKAALGVLSDGLKNFGCNQTKHEDTEEDF